MHDKKRFLLTIFAAAFAFAPHILRLPFLVSAALFSAWGYALGMQFRGWPVLPHLARTVLTFGCVLLAMLSTGQVGSRDMLVSLLCLMLGMKALESKSIRDVLAILFLSYFVVVTNVLYSESLPMTVFMLGSTLVLTAALTHIYSGEEHFWPDLRTASLLVLQALPLTLILFFFFPRLSGALWGLYKSPAESFESGFSEVLTPGDLFQLSLSQDSVFRAHFEGALPPNALRYWRGAVLGYFDGNSWREESPFLEQNTPRPVSFQPENVRQTDTSGMSRNIRYSLTLEPHRKYWIFALDFPVSVPAGARRSKANILSATRKITSRKMFLLDADPLAFPADEPHDPRWIQLPAEGDEQTRALARQWRSETRSTEEFLQKIQDFFHANFRYTLQPEENAGKSVDKFLFQARTGYCAHFASAAVFLLRAADIPARVVIGYQGGEVNPLGGYLLVRQAHAHAWTEVWHEDIGWVRFDPTSAVAPERIEQGIEALLQKNAREKGAEAAPTTQAVHAARHALFLGWDAVNTLWNRWFLSFSHRQQRELWRNLGLDFLQGTAWGVLAVVLFLGMGLFMLFIWWLLRNHKPQDPVILAYQKFCQFMARKGVVRQRAEGPHDFLERICRDAPELSREATEILQLYIEIRYQGKGQVCILQERVRAFSRRYAAMNFPQTVSNIRKKS